MIPSHLELYKKPEPETTTVTLQQWVAVVQHMQEQEPEGSHSMYFVHAGQYLADIAVGYMDAPVCIYKGKTISAKAEKITDIAEFKNRFISTGAKIALYAAIWQPLMPAFIKLSPATFEPVLCDPPEVTGGYWIMRYSEINEIDQGGARAAAEGTLHGA